MILSAFFPGWEEGPKIEDESGEHNYNPLKQTILSDWILKAIKLMFLK